MQKSLLDVSHANRFAFRQTYHRMAGTSVALQVLSPVAYGYHYLEGIVKLGHWATIDGHHENMARQPCVPENILGHGVRPLADEKVGAVAPFGVTNRCGPVAARLVPALVGH